MSLPFNRSAEQGASLIKRMLHILSSMKTPTVWTKHQTTLYKKMSTCYLLSSVCIGVLRQVWLINSKPMDNRP